MPNEYALFSFPVSNREYIKQVTLFDDRKPEAATAV
jgi:hypothetical protein